MQTEPAGSQKATVHDGEKERRAERTHPKGDVEQSPGGKERTDKSRNSDTQLSSALTYIKY